MANARPNVGIIGYGRFGQILAELLSPHCDLFICDPQTSQSEIKHGKCVSEAVVLEQEALFYCVPIGSFPEVLKSHAQALLARDTPPVILDVLSVKSFPKKVIGELFKGKLPAILTHPMFGPDSVRMQGVQGQVVVVENVGASPDVYEKWKSLFAEIGLTVLELAAEEHDRLAADSQGVAHFIGRVLDSFDLKETPIDTVGAKKLQEIREQTCNDTWELFSDLQTRNPFTMSMRLRLGEALDAVYSELLPKQVEPGVLTVGIQGGVGSFNEEAARYRLARTGVENYRLKYLHTTERVLQELHEGHVDCGQFAMHNSIGGVVQESIEAIAKYRFHIVEQYAIQISHALMTHPDVTLDEIDTVMTHPQVLKQCKKNIEQKYPRLTFTSGEGELIDHAAVAPKIANGELSRNIATMGSSALAEAHGLRIVEKGLQDLQENFTSFMWVSRPHPTTSCIPRT